MNSHVTEWLAAYHDGELSGRRLAHVESHLKKCEVCQIALAQLASLSALLGEAPEAEMSFSADRFAAQVGLQLTRQPRHKSEPVSRPGWVWTALPVSLLVGIAFLQVVRWMAGGLSLAQMFGFGEAAVSRLTNAPVRPTGILAQISSELIHFGVPFSPQMLIGLILPAILSVGYLVWLIVWGLNQGEFEATQM
ncbi:MAG: zf-HC2 domain-containing protein [Chloroflexota bacterium]